MDIARWMAEYLDKLRETFGAERLVCVGLQGSQAQGEAGPESDIDAVLILDRAEGEDLLRYRAALEQMPQREKICGFVSGRRELACWERGDLFSFYYDTVPFYGSLDFIGETLTPADARRAVHNGECALYHACAHNLVHAHSGEVLSQLQKSLFFTLRALHFCRTGTFLRRRGELLPALPEEERALLRGAGTLEEASAALLGWCGRTMAACTGEDGALFWEKAWKSAPECGMIDKTLDPSVS